ncbi:hypothetical protein VIRA109638_13090 [Vibrio rarus]
MHNIKIIITFLFFHHTVGQVKQYVNLKKKLVLLKLLLGIRKLEMLLSKIAQE